MISISQLQQQMEEKTQAEFDRRLEAVETKLSTKRAARFELLTAQVNSSDSTESAQLIDAINRALDDLYISDLQSQTESLENEFDALLEHRLDQLDQLDINDGGSDAAAFDAGDSHSEHAPSNTFYGGN